MASRRQNQTGTVYRRGDGRWVASIMIDGKRVSRYAKSEEEAWHKMLGLTLAATTPPASPTLESYLQRWLAARTHLLRPVSVYRYQRVLRHLLDTPAAQVRLSELTAAHLRDALAHVGAEGSRWLVRYLHSLLLTALREAVEIDALLVRNPMLKVPAPRYFQIKRLRWDVAQARQFLTYMTSGRLPKNSRHPAFFVVALTAGLRFSELNGLHWTDIQLDEHGVSCLWVRRQTYWLPPEKRWVTEVPKSEHSQRQIVLTRHAVAALLEHGPQSAGPVFRSRLGQPLTVQWGRVRLRTLCHEAGVPVITPHGLRHAAATLCYAATGSAYAVQRLLGHSSVSVTTRIYGYQEADPRRTAAAMQHLLDGGSADD